jgi:hypothetical protein
MRQMSTRMPVLYVNSIGMRTPSPGEGRMFFSRVRRKLRSMRRGLVRVGDNLWVYSPLIVPSKLGIALGGPLVSRAVRAAAARRGITRPLVWVACPTAAGLIEAIDPAAVVYQRTDRYECFKDVDADRIIALDGWLKARADLTVFCSTALYEAEAEDCRRATYADHGVDFDRFVAATVQPPDMADLGNCSWISPDNCPKHSSPLSGRARCRPVGASFPTCRCLASVTTSGCRLTWPPATC